MQTPEIQVINWTAVGVGIGILTAALSLAVIYLKLFIKGEIGEVEQRLIKQFHDGQKEIMHVIEAKFSQKELVQKDILDHERRLDQIERLMERIRLTKESDDRST